jgi:hypothetical protein
MPAILMIPCSETVDAAYEAEAQGDVRVELVSTPSRRDSTQPAAIWAPVSRYLLAGIPEGQEAIESA